MYSEKVMDHFYHPRNVGEIEDADGVGVVGNPFCGDVMKITIRVNHESQTIEDIKFKTFGCGAAITTSSMVTEMIHGKDLPLKEAMKIANKTVAEALHGLPPIKIQCTNLVSDALHAAIEDYLKKKGIEGVSKR